MHLRELQREFQQRVLTHAGSIDRELVGAADEDFDARLGAYVDGYRSRLVEALGETYPALKATLGAGEFDRRMREYVDSTPSQYYSVRYYGGEVAERLPEAALADLARWEWTLADVFDAPDDLALDAQELGKVPPDAWARVSFSFRACVRRLRTGSNAVDCWRAANEGRPAPEVLNTGAATEWLMWRRGTTTLFRSLDPIEASMLDAARRGLVFAAQCECLVGSMEETQVAMRAASLLRSWISEELIAGCVLRDEAA
jgi:hypothetical protein